MKQITDRQDCGCYLQATETEVGGWAVIWYMCMMHRLAPELLEALKKANDWITMVAHIMDMEGISGSSYHRDVEFLEMIRDVIEKAEGRKE